MVALAASLAVVLPLAKLESGVELTVAIAAPVLSSINFQHLKMASSNHNYEILAVFSFSLYLGGETFKTELGTLVSSVVASFFGVNSVLTVKESSFSRSQKLKFSYSG